MELARKLTINACFMNTSIFSTALLISLLLLVSAGAPQKNPVDKPRLLVLTDIGGDPDDTQSLRRLLVYANEFRFEGFVATSDNIPRPGYKHQINTHLILEAIDDYADVRDNLLLHAPGYPDAGYLRSIVHGGQVNRGVENLAPGLETPGSRHIIKSVDSSREPLFIIIWGGAHDLAQALLDVKSTRSPKQVEKFTRKIRVYAISDQDAINNVHPKGTGAWIRENFPDMWYVEAGPLTFGGMTALFRGMYQNDSRGGEFLPLPLVKPGLEQLNNEQWIRENVTAWGPLGEGYPSSVGQNPGSERNTRGVKEGDTPSWFFVFQNGLNDPRHPEWGGWGGRFIHQERAYYTDAQDEHWSGEHDASVMRKWTVARYREAYQNDFAARMRWCKLSYDEANHNPVGVIGKDATRDILKMKVKKGQTVEMDASASYDPDGDNIRYNWWIYKEISASGASLENSDQAVVHVQVPESSSGEEIHLILEVTDNGNPALTSYRRVVLQVR